MLVFVVGKENFDQHKALKPGYEPGSHWLEAALSKLHAASLLPWFPEIYSSTTVNTSVTQASHTPNLIEEARKTVEANKAFSSPVKARQRPLYYFSPQRSCLSCVGWFLRAFACFCSLYYPWGKMRDYSYSYHSCKFINIGSNITL